MTVTSIFLAFYSIIAAIKQEFLMAAALILAAGFFDGIDGKVARLTNTTTRFGLELDSLADVIAFGVAPAMMTYLWALQGTGRIGDVSAFLFVACGALRLARFNVQSGTIDPKRFNGLPIPAAAAMMATTVLFFHKLEVDPAEHRTGLLILNTAMAVFMVSSIKFHAFKDLTLVKERPFRSTVAFVSDAGPDSYSSVCRALPHMRGLRDIRSDSYGVVVHPQPEKVSGTDYSNCKR